VIATNIVVTILAPGPLSELRNVSNPFGLEGHPWLANVNDAIGLVFPLCLLASASSLIGRYLHAGEVVREQIKWLAFAASVVAPGVSGAVIHGKLFALDATGGTNPLSGTFWMMPLL
jgi:hypothetical protein